MFFFFNISALSTLILHFFILFPSLHAYSSSYLPSISLPISFFPLLFPPTLSLTECCGASAAGSLPNCYITVPSASLNHCWARLALARVHILLSYLKYCPTAKRLSVWVQITLAFLISDGKLVISGACQAEPSTNDTALQCKLRPIYCHYARVGTKRDAIFISLCLQVWMM